MRLSCVWKFQINKESPKKTKQKKPKTQANDNKNYQGQNFQLKTYMLFKYLISDAPTWCRKQLLICQVRRKCRFKKPVSYVTQMMSGKHMVTKLEKTLQLPSLLSCCRCYPQILTLLHLMSDQALDIYSVGTRTALNFCTGEFPRFSTVSNLCSLS